MKAVKLLVILLVTCGLAQGALAQCYGAKESPDTFAYIALGKFRCEGLLQKNEEIMNVYNRGIIGCEDPMAISERKIARVSLDENLSKIKDAIVYVQSLLDDLGHPCMPQNPLLEIWCREKIDKIFEAIEEDQGELWQAVQPAE